jgi:hypothetical protein
VIESELDSVEPTEVQVVVLHSLSNSNENEVTDWDPDTEFEAMVGVQLQVQ